MKVFSAIRDRIGGIFRWFWHLSWWKKIGLIIILLIVGYFVTAPIRPKKDPYTYDAVQRQTVTDVVSESGNLANTGEVDVQSTATGVMEKLFVANGDTVKTGQKLFAIKSTASPQEKATATANYLLAKATYDNAQATAQSLRSSMYTKWRKYLDLATNSTYQNADQTPNNSNRHDATEFQVAQSDWYAAQATYQNQQETISQAQAALSSASYAYQSTRDATVTAPVDGVVQNLAYMTGDKVTAGTVTIPNTVLFLVSNQTPTVKVQLNEVDIAKVKIGQRAMITLPAIRDKKFDGHVVKLDSIGLNTSGVITYNAYITVDNPDPTMRPAMTANIDIETARHENVLTVTNEAIKPYKNGKAVQIVVSTPQPYTLQFVPVTIGLKGIDRTEITSGISDGTKVVTGSSTPVKTSGGLGGG